MVRGAALRTNRFREEALEELCPIEDDEHDGETNRQCATDGLGELGAADAEILLGGGEK